MKRVSAKHEEEKIEVYHTGTWPEGDPRNSMGLAESMRKSESKEEEVNKLETITEFEEPPLSQQELRSLRWKAFGICPICHFNVQDWSAGPFNAERYNKWRDQGIDPLTGHSVDCDEKWRRSP